MMSQAAPGEEPTFMHRSWSGDAMEYMRRFEAVMGFERDERGVQHPLSMADRERYVVEVLKEYMATHPVEYDRLASGHRPIDTRASGAPGARVLVRLPRSLHEDLKACAHREGMSLNSVLIAAVTAWVTRRSDATG